jgi:hypothetical protein
MYLYWLDLKPVPGHPGQEPLLRHEVQHGGAAEPGGGLLTGEGLLFPLPVNEQLSRCKIRRRRGFCIWFGSLSEWRVQSLFTWQSIPLPRCGKSYLKSKGDEALRYESL